MIGYLQSFEKIGVKKIPQRLQVLKEMKDAIENDMCSVEDLLSVIEAYPKLLKNKVSQ